MKDLFSSHQCGRAWFWPGALCGMSLLLVVTLLRVFFSGFSGFPPSTKTKIFKFQFNQDSGPTWKPATGWCGSSLNVVIYFIQIIETGSCKVLLASTLFDLRIPLPVCITALLVISHWSRNCCKRPSWPLTQCPRWVSKRGQWRKRVSTLPSSLSLFSFARPLKLIPHSWSHKMTV